MTVLARTEPLFSEWVSPEDAAYILRVSKAWVAAKAIAGEIRWENGLYLRSDVEDLAAQRTPPEGYAANRFPRRDGLDRMPEKVLWLIQDWGGEARVLDFQVALQLPAAPVRNYLLALTEYGYVERPNRRQWRITDAGRGYLADREPPI